MAVAGMEKSQGMHSETMRSQIEDRSIIRGVARVSSEQATRYESKGRDMVKSRDEVRNRQKGRSVRRIQDQVHNKPGQQQR